MTPSSIISGIPPTSDATTGRDSAIASRIERPCASRQDGRTATSSAAVTAGMSSRRPVKTTRWATVGRRPLLEGVAPRALADDQQVRVGDLAQDRGQASISVWWPFSGSSRATTPDDLRARLHPVLVAQRAARLLVVVALEVDAVVDQADRGAGPVLVGDLALDRLARPRSAGPSRGVSWRSSSRSSCGADPRRMDRRDDVRPAMAALAERHRGLRPDDVGAVHVGVDDVGLDEPRGGRPGRRSRRRRRARRSR